MAEENPCVLFRTHGYKKTVQAKSGLSQRPAGNFSPLLQKEGIFVVPLAMGLRVALSAVSEEKCRIVARAIKKAMDEYFAK